MNKMLRYFILLALPPVFCLLFTGGCNRQGAKLVQATSGAAEATQGVVTVKTVKPNRNTVQRVIEQPGELLAFEQTPIYSKIAGYVKKVNKDIGDTVRTNEVLAELWVPEMDVDLKRKVALVRKAEAEAEQSRRLLDAAQAALQGAVAKVREAEAGRLRAKAEMDRANSQYERLKKSTGVVTQDVLDEARLGLEAAQATVAEVEAKIKSAEANRVASSAQRDKAEADIGVAEASLQVATADRDHAKTLLDYAEVRAPFDGVVSRRHIDTGHFLSATGGKGDPLFVVVRTDPVRVMIDIPEIDSVLIDGTTRTQVGVQALKGRQFSGTVRRSAWTLDPRSRTLRTEIDIPNPDGVLRPGMYVQAALTVEHANAWTVPESAIVRHSGQTFVWQVSDGKATQRLVQTGLSDGKVVEILKLQAIGAPGEWQEVTGHEAAIVSPTTLKDGQHVEIGR
jgi:multidrug efflux pump subunit AcrA (membrane-fusion protein)